MLDDIQHPPSGRDPPLDIVAPGHSPPPPDPVPRALQVISSVDKTPPGEVSLSKGNQQNDHFVSNTPTSTDLITTNESASLENVNSTHEDGQRDGEDEDMNSDSPKITPETKQGGVVEGVVDQQSRPASGNNFYNQSTEITETENTQKNKKNNQNKNSQKKNPPTPSEAPKPHTSGAFLKKIRFCCKDASLLPKTAEQIQEADFLFLKSETRINSSIQNSNFRMSQNKRIFERKSKKSNFFDFLNYLPESHYSVKLNLKNQFNVPISTVEKEVDKVFMDLKDNFMADYRRIAIKAGFADMPVDSLNPSKDPPRAEENEESVIHLSKSERYEIAIRELQRTLTAAVACVFLANSRVIKDKVYIMGAKSLHYITYITTHLAPGFQGYNYISDTAVVAKINELAQKAQFFDPDQQDRYFTLERSSVPSGSFLWVTVSFFPMKNPKEYFEQVFLTPGDVVTSWVIDESSGTTDRVTVDALIDLVLDKIPPRKLIMDRRKQHLSCLLKHDKGKQWIEEDKAELAARIAMEEEESPETTRLRTSIERAEKLNAEHCSGLLDLIDRNQREKQYEVREDPAQMRCEIEFSEQYCPICHTTGHPLKDCSVRGCSICHKSSHPFYKCPSKCKCNIRPFHMEQECPKLREQNKASFATPPLQKPQVVNKVASNNKKSPVYGGQYSVLRNLHTSDDTEPVNDDEKDEDEDEDEEENEKEPADVEIVEAGSQDEEVKYTDNTEEESDDDYIEEDSEESDSSSMILSSEESLEYEKVDDFPASQKEVSEASSEATKTTPSFEGKVSADQTTTGKEPIGSFNARIHHLEGPTTPTQTNSLEQRPQPQSLEKQTSTQSSMPSIESFVTQSGFHVPHSRSAKKKDVTKSSDQMGNPSPTTPVITESSQSPMSSIGGSSILKMGVTLPVLAPPTEGKDSLLPITSDRTGSKQVHSKQQSGEFSPQDVIQLQTPFKGSSLIAPTPRTPNTSSFRLLIPRQEGNDEDTEVDEFDSLSFPTPKTPSKTGGLEARRQRLMQLDGLVPGSQARTALPKRRLLYSGDPLVTPKRPSSRPSTPIGGKGSSRPSTPIGGKGSLQKMDTTARLRAHQRIARSRPSTPLNWAETELPEAFAVNSQPSSQITPTQVDETDSAKTSNNNNNDL